MSPRRNAYAAPAWAGSQRLGDVGLKATLLILANYADEAFSCYPSQETIADETEQSVRTVRRQIELLREVGLVKSERRINDHGHRTTDRHYLQIDIVASKGDVREARARLADRKDAQELEDTVSGSPNGPSLPDNMTGRPEDTVTGGLPDTQVASGLEAKPASLPDTAMAEELLSRTPRSSLANDADAPPADAALFVVRAGVEPPAKRTRKAKEPKPPDPVLEHAKAVCGPWWESLRIKPAGERSFMNIAQLAAQDIAAGRSDTEIARALHACGVAVTRAALNFQYEKQDRGERATQRHVNDRIPEGW